MADIVWLASYPKSGNTWLRVFLSNYLADTDQPVSINKLGTHPIASSRDWFDEWAGVKASALAPDLVERLRPRVYRCMARSSSETLFMKAHDAWRRFQDGDSLFPPDVSLGAVYVVRNPLDVAPSYAAHLGVDLSLAVERMCDPTCQIGGVLGKGTYQLRQTLNSWSDHVGSWVDQDTLPVHVVRYEDMKRDPVAAFTKIVDFCRLPKTPQRIDRAVAHSDFSTLQAQECAEGFNERPLNAAAAFFRKGRVGGWRDELAAPLVDRIIQCHGAMMRRFGYVDADGRPLSQGVI